MSNEPSRLHLDVLTVLCHRCKSNFNETAKLYHSRCINRLYLNNTIGDIGSIRSFHGGSGAMHV